ncbi:hypothetical protein ACLOJK_012325 [Asimina triloba]
MLKSPAYQHAEAQALNGGPRIPQSAKHKVEVKAQYSSSARSPLKWKPNSDTLAVTSAMDEERAHNRCTRVPLYPSQTAAQLPLGIVSNPTMRLAYLLGQLK